VDCLRCSKAHCCLDESIRRKLLIQAFCCEVVRAFTKLGIAIAANKPIMATTIMISTKVKPRVFAGVLFIFSFCFFFLLARREHAKERVILELKFTHCSSATVFRILALFVPKGHRRPLALTRFATLQTVESRRAIVKIGTSGATERGLGTFPSPC